MAIVGWPVEDLLNKYGKMNPMKLYIYKFSLLLFSIVLIFSSACKQGREGEAWSGAGDIYHEAFRPQFHFTPQKNWMGPPSGLIYHNGTYHMFYSYNPDTTYLGALHWGHAVSEDLMHWEPMGVSLKPDSLGQILPGSVVLDSNNTSGLGSMQHTAMIAAFTYKRPKENSNQSVYEQGLAYSLDEGRSWHKYDYNPVLSAKQGQNKLRHPDLFWHEKTQKWIMALSGNNKIWFYGSPDMKKWNFLSEFKAESVSPDERWCHPDLFSIKAESQANRKRWILLVSIEQGGPSGGSATRYFIGDFDGTSYTSHLDDKRWMDYGKDFFGAKTFSNITVNGNEKISMGWMNNWDYAQLLPTHPWRGAMSIPKKLSLTHIHGKKFLTSHPVNELEKLRVQDEILEPVKVRDEVVLSEGLKNESLPLEIILNFRTQKHTQIGFAERFGIKLSGSSNQMRIGYDNYHGAFYIDRSRSEITNISETYSTSSYAPYLQTDSITTMRILIDRSSVELIGEEGKRSVTSRFFTKEPLSQISLYAHNGSVPFDGGKVFRLSSIWKDYTRDK